MAFCDQCGNELREGANFCGRCGTPVEDSAAAEEICPNCGEPLEAEEAFCAYCGTAVTGTESEGIQPETEKYNCTVCGYTCSAAEYKTLKCCPLCKVPLIYLELKK